MNFTLKCSHNVFVKMNRMNMQVGDILYDNPCDNCGSYKYDIVDIDDDNPGDFHLSCSVCGTRVLLLTNKKTCTRIKNMLPNKKITEYAYCHKCLSRELMIIEFTPKKIQKCCECGAKYFCQK